jgi:hypothetical protein
MPGESQVPRRPPRIAFIVIRKAALLLIGLALFSASSSAQSPDQTPEMSADPQIAAALKQISADHIQANIDKLVSFGTRITTGPQDEAAIKSGRGIGAAREWIKSEFEHYSKDCGGCLEVKTDTFTAPEGKRVAQPTELTNVYAVLKGSDPANASRIVLVTGHYDSINSNFSDVTGNAPGANDDGSGTAVSLECARVLSKLKFPATIIFLTVAGEEQGLIGSHHFAEMAKQQGWDIEAALNNDIVGGDKNPGQDHSVVRVYSQGVPAGLTEQELDRLRTFGTAGAETDSGSRELARYIAEIGRTYDTGLKPMLVFRQDRVMRGGDHYSFNEQGYSAVRFTEFHEDFHHQHQNVRTESGIEYGDLPKFVDYDYVEKAARLNAATLASLASAPAPPVNVHLLMKQYDSDTRLQWDPSPGGLATGYEILWRLTTSPEWEHVQPVGNVPSTTLQIPKDIYFFAVEAVDQAGHRSLPVVPTIQR